MMKNAFYFILIALFVLKIWSRGKKEDEVSFKIHDVTTCLTNNYNTHIPQYLKK